MSNDFGITHSVILVFRELPPSQKKVEFFSEPPKYYSFSSSIPSYLLKVTEFFGKISQFEFLVIAKKNILLINFFCH